MSQLLLGTRHSKSKVNGAFRSLNSIMLVFLSQVKSKYSSKKASWKKYFPFGQNNLVSPGSKAFPL
ncbi:hypothetical protein MHBO_001602 [Bonamia ostreae]|uniref:Ribosomal protein L32 n=1 Tax=Bonamia ostreae TaxID=126728 RepID=A0ABV2AJI4_9EUKA